MLATAAVTAVLSAAPVVELAGGRVQGTALPGVNEFLGIPFASAARYQPPVDFHGKFKTDPLVTTDFGPACMQVGNTVNETYGSEDCLFGNVWQPAGAKPGDKLPVIVFIYGGSNQFGETEAYNGSAMAARHNVVWASVAYRTGPIGWMAFKEDVEAGRATGTFGMMDQQAGLRWVRREVGRFGGDPDTIVIHGQSSGAMCTELHMVMPGSKGLIRGLVSESGGLGANNLTRAVQNSEAIAKAVGCTGSVKKCLQTIDPIHLTSQTYSYGWGPAIDGVVIPDEPNAMLSRGEINDVSVMMGAQTNDSNKGLIDHPMTVADYEKSVEEIVGKEHLAQALSLYPADSGNLVQNPHILGSVNSDAMLCGLRRRLSLVNKKNHGKAFMYRFNYWYQSNPKCTSDPNWHDNTTGPRHEDEVTFVMGQPIFMFDGSCCGKWGARLTREPCPQLPSCVDCWDPALGEGYHAYFNDKEWAFSQLVGGYWANLARYGTPNGGNSTGFPVFPDGGDVTKNIVLDADIPNQHKQETSLYDNPAYCQFWDVVKPRYH
eukprot:TRINITY_DN11304_c1_g1_i1.p1 TRINITY_DN11304_c1_g1~~TRINITY_DN11304_c1_g1_i1.p1  ORF type:complete len:576 (+),score=181.59 TRINITY_DN11304_c1_g1_i1:95-1729(+)